MRRLLYVPIIHDQADMGSLGEALARQSVVLAGESRWRLHERSVRQFWDSVEAFLRTLDARRLKAYQDGLAAGGQVGRRIVQEAASRGSRNYQAVLNLLERGAVLCKTEDAQLLLQEHHDLRAALNEESVRENQSNHERQPPPWDRLLAQRDAFIAHAIAETLQEGEIGVLFLGAHHHATSGLPEDIVVVALKDQERVRGYLEELLHGRDDARLRALAKYLASPVTGSV